MSALQEQDCLSGVFERNSVSRGEDLFGVLMRRGPGEIDFFQDFFREVVAPCIG